MLIVENCTEDLLRRHVPVIANIPGIGLIAIETEFALHHVQLLKIILVAVFKFL